MLDFDLRPGVGAWIGVGRRSNYGFGRWAGVADCRLAWDLRYGVLWFVATGTRRVVTVLWRWRLVEPGAERRVCSCSRSQIADYADRRCEVNALSKAVFRIVAL